jgi:hypothetical protein
VKLGSEGVLCVAQLARTTSSGYRPGRLATPRARGSMARALPSHGRGWRFDTSRAHRTTMPQPHGRGIVALVAVAGGVAGTRRRRPRSGTLGAARPTTGRGPR